MGTLALIERLCRLAAARPTPEDVLKGAVDLVRRLGVQALVDVSRAEPGDRPAPGLSPSPGAGRHHRQLPAGGDFFDGQPDSERDELDVLADRFWFEAVQADIAAEERWRLPAYAYPRSPKEVEAAALKTVPDAGSNPAGDTSDRPPLPVADCDTVQHVPGCGYPELGHYEDPAVIEASAGAPYMDLRDRPHYEEDPDGADAAPAAADPYMDHRFGGAQGFL
jgi:hypothetical protein